uniref:F-box domain-containing protein n=1 Tax=Caenorhabditis tropicalis TaxID=1561998 RepID=A0A1I7TLB3_9PELO
MFQFLRLPQVALTIVIRFMSPIQLLFLASISVRARKTVNFHCRKNTFKFTLTFTDEDLYENMQTKQMRIQYEGSSTKDRHRFEIVSSAGSWPFLFKGSIQPNKYYYNWPESYHKYDYMQHMRNILLDVIGTFNKPTVSFEILGGVAPMFATKLINDTEMRSCPIELVYMQLKNVRRASLGKFMTACSNVHDLVIRTKLCPHEIKRSYVPMPEFKAMRCDHVILVNGYWANLENFLSCRRLTLIDKTVGRQYPFLTAPRLNYAIKKWRNADCKLEKLVIPFPIVDNFKKVVRDLCDNGIDVVGTTKYKFFQKADGRNARVYYRNGKLEVSVQPKNA